MIRDWRNPMKIKSFKHQIILSTIPLLVLGCAGSPTSGANTSSTASQPVEQSTSSATSSTVIQGASTAVTHRTLKPGDVCQFGGIEVSSGIDKNGNGTLDENEVINTESVCNGIPGVDGITPLFATSTVTKDCSNGGVSFSFGLDSNGDSLLSSEEITSTNEVCNGADGNTGATGLQGAKGDAGTAGTKGDKGDTGAIGATGSQGLTGAKGEKGDKGDAGAIGAKGDPGLGNSLITSKIEPVGANCKAGGTAFSIGLDNNQNSILDAAEVIATQYACNGQNATSVKVTAEAAGLNCPATGGKKITTGIDLNGDNLLSSNEITTTEYVCGDPTNPDFPIVRSGSGFGITEKFYLKGGTTYKLRFEAQGNVSLTVDLGRLSSGTEDRIISSTQTTVIGELPIRLGAGVDDFFYIDVQTAVHSTKWTATITPL